MDKEKLAPWIERLNKAEGKDFAAIVAEMARENSLKEGEAWKLLKSAGFDPKEAEKAKSQLKAGGKKISVVLRHKTEYPRYRRAGLVLTQKAETYEVTEEQLATLKKDCWVVIGEDKKDGEK
ncbi:MAG: hypothetical protein LBI28_12700 [Treponema sp.]|jgi:hypothetical protein|nr:hypothetical protein [Treponema sp.]